MTIAAEIIHFVSRRIADLLFDLFGFSCFGYVNLIITCLDESKQPFSDLSCQVSEYYLVTVMLFLKLPMNMDSTKNEFCIKLYSSIGRIETNALTWHKLNQISYEANAIINVQI